MIDTGKTTQTRRIKVLIIAEAANPMWVSVPLEGWSHSQAISRVVDAHIVTQIRNRDAFCDAGLVHGQDFTAIDSERVNRPLSKLASMLRGGGGKGWTTVTAFNTLAYAYFERCVWKQFGSRIKAGEFDLVHRITPLSPTAPSRLATWCKRAGVPFVMGPLNGGLPWPAGFDSHRRREKEWLSYVRNVYKLMPGYRSTRRDAAAMIIGSRATFEQMPKRYHEKCVYIPENAVDPARFTKCVTRDVSLPLKLVFVGRLVPYKGADMLIKAAAPLMRQGKVKLDLVGDGPMMPQLRELCEQLDVTDHVTMDGWVEHTQLQNRLLRSGVFAFPSIREFGGAVVLEAMAVGLVPIVMDYGGPGELVSEQTGFAIPMGRPEQIIERVAKALEQLVAAPAQLQTMRQRARERALSRFTWDAKARQVFEVYRWLLGHRLDKPDWGMPLPDETLEPSKTSTTQTQPDMIGVDA